MMTEKDTAVTDPVDSVAAGQGDARVAAVDESPAVGGVEAEGDGDRASDETPNAEAARYRRRLRETEAERDALTERLARLQRAEAERLAAGVLVDGGDLWRDGADIAEVLDENGDVDPDRVAALATKVAAQHPHWQRRAQAAAPASEVTAAGTITDAEAQPRSWRELLRSTAGA